MNGTGKENEGGPTPEAVEAMLVEARRLTALARAIRERSLEARLRARNRNIPVPAAADAGLLDAPKRPMRAQ